MSFRIFGLSRRLAADADGGVAIIVALSLPVILGVSALALEYGSALITRSENQRTSDVAAFAAAHAYNRDPSASEPDKREAATTAANSIAALNDVPSGVSVSFEDTADKGTIDVTISEDKPIYLSRLLRPDDSVTISTLARIALAPGDSPGDSPPPCVLALGEDEDGGFRINGAPAGRFNVTGCGIGSNSEISINGGPLEDLKCSAPSFKNESEDNDDNEHCGKQNRVDINKNPYEDPFAESVSELDDFDSNPPQDSDGNDICDHIGKFPDDFEQQKRGNKITIKSGTLCVTEFGNIKDVSSDFKGDGNTLVIEAGKELEMKGNDRLTIIPPKSGEFSGVGFYGPTSKFNIGGNSNFIIQGNACNGLIASSIRFDGKSTLEVNCNKENNDDEENNDSASSGGKPHLIR